VDGIVHTSPTDSIGRFIGGGGGGFFAREGGGGGGPFLFNAEPFKVPELALLEMASPYEGGLERPW
jgi:hypothetical protein